MQNRSQANLLRTNLGNGGTGFIQIALYGENPNTFGQYFSPISFFYYPADENDMTYTHQPQSPFLSASFDMFSNELYLTYLRTDPDNGALVIITQECNPNPLVVVDNTE